MSYLERLIEAQNKDLYSARAYIERAESEKRELSVEERTAWDAINAEMDTRQDHINEVRNAEMRDARVAEAMASAPEVRSAAVQSEVRTDSDILRAMARGEIRSHTFEQRALSKATSTKGPETVPQDFLATVQAKLLTTGPMLDGGVVNLLNTNSGNDIKVPVESTRAAGTAVADVSCLARRGCRKSRSWHRKYGGTCRKTHHSSSQIAELHTVESNEGRANDRSDCHATSEHAPQQ